MQPPVAKLVKDLASYSDSAVVVKSSPVPIVLHDWILGLLTGNSTRKYMSTVLRVGCRGLTTKLTCTASHAMSLFVSHIHETILNGILQLSMHRSSDF